MKTGIFNTPIKNWLAAMQKAKRIQPGGKLVFLNKQTGAPVPPTQSGIPDPNGQP